MPFPLVNPLMLNIFSSPSPSSSSSFSNVEKAGEEAGTLSFFAAATDSLFLVLLLFRLGVFFLPFLLSNLDLTSFTEAISSLFCFVNNVRTYPPVPPFPLGAILPGCTRESPEGSSLAISPVPLFRSMMVKYLRTLFLMGLGSFLGEPFPSLTMAVLKALCACSWSPMR